MRIPGFCLVPAFLLLAPGCYVYDLDGLWTREGSSHSGSKAAADFGRSQRPATGAVESLEITSRPGGGQFFRLVIFGNAADGAASKEPPTRALEMTGRVYWSRGSVMEFEAAGADCRLRGQVYPWDAGPYELALMLDVSYIADGRYGSGSLRQHRRRPPGAADFLAAPAGAALQVAGVGAGAVVGAPVFGAALLLFGTGIIKINTIH